MRRIRNTALGTMISPRPVPMGFEAFRQCFTQKTNRFNSLRCVFFRGGNHILKCSRLCFVGSFVRFSLCSNETRLFSMPTRLPGENGSRFIAVVWADSTTFMMRPRRAYCGRFHICICFIPSQTCCEKAWNVECLETHIAAKKQVSQPENRTTLA